MAESVASAAQEASSSSSPSWSEFLQKKADFAALPVPQDWQGWLSYKLLEWLLYAIEDPWGFTTTLILAVSPLFFVSAILSWKLAKMMEREEAEKKRKARRASAARAAVASSKPSAKQRGHKQQSEHHPKAD